MSTGLHSYQRDVTSLRPLCFHLLVIQSSTPLRATTGHMGICAAQLMLASFPVTCSRWAYPLTQKSEAGHKQGTQACDNVSH